MKLSLYITTAAFVGALAVTSFAPAFMSPANATGYDCSCDGKDKDKDKGKDKGKGHGRQGNNGFGNGGHDGVPGNSGKQDKTR